MRLNRRETTVRSRTEWRAGRPIACARIRLLNRIALVVTILAAWTGIAIADQVGQLRFRLTSSDLAAAAALAKQIAALSPSTRPEETTRLAQCAYSSASHLRREYGVIWPPLLNNILVNSGIKKRGLCFQWAEDLLVALDALNLTSLELHWGEAQAGTWQESNCVVVTGKGQPFEAGSFSIAGGILGISTGVESALRRCRGSKTAHTRASSAINQPPPQVVASRFRKMKRNKNAMNIFEVLKLTEIGADDRFWVSTRWQALRYSAPRRFLPRYDRPHFSFRECAPKRLIAGPRRCLRA
jgi:hypothetical protein